MAKNNLYYRYYIDTTFWWHPMLHDLLGMLFTKGYGSTVNDWCTDKMWLCKLIYFGCGTKKKYLQKVDKAVGTKEYTQVAAELWLRSKGQILQAQQHF
jgi:hypothetical protein